MYNNCFLYKIDGDLDNNALIYLCRNLSKGIMSKLESLRIEGNVILPDCVDLLKMALQNGCCLTLNSIYITAPVKDCLDLKKAILKRGCPNFKNIEICIIIILFISI